MTLGVQVYCYVCQCFSQVGMYRKGCNSWSDVSVDRRRLFVDIVGATIGMCVCVCIVMPVRLIRELFCFVHFRRRPTNRRIFNKRLKKIFGKFIFNWHN